MTPATARAAPNDATRSGEWFTRVWTWYLSLSEGQRFVVVTVAAFASIFARRPEQLLSAEFYGEDGAVFYVGTYFGSVPQVLFRPYAGYDNVLTRLLAYVERAVPVLWAPFIANLGAMILVALLAAFLASGRLQKVVPHAGMRLAIAALLVFLPDSAQTLGIAADMMRYAPLYLLALSLATIPLSRLGRAADLIVAGLVGISGPASILMLPLFLWRAWKERERHMASLAVVQTLASIVQLSTVFVSGRHPANFATPIDLFRAFTFRTTVQSLFGEQVTSVLTRVGIPFVIGLAAVLAIGAALVWAWRRALPPEARWPVMWTFLVVTLASAFAQTEGGATLLTVGLGSRYFLHSTALCAVVVVAAFVKLRQGWPKRVAMILTVMLAIGIGGDLRMFPFPSYNWATTYTCIGGRAPCEVDVFPPPLWTIHWPGIDGKYIQPRPGA